MQGFHIKMIAAIICWDIVIDWYIVLDYVTNKYLRAWSYWITSSLEADSNYTVGIPISNEN